MSPTLSGVDPVTIATTLGAGALLAKIADRILTKPDRELDAATKLREELRGDIRRMSERIAVLETKVSEITAERDTHRATALVREAERDIARKHVAELEADNALLREEGDALRAENESLRAEIVELRREVEAERDIARKHVAELEADNALLREEGDALRAENESLRAEIVELRREVATGRDRSGEREDAADDEATG